MAAFLESLKIELSGSTDVVYQTFQIHGTPCTLVFIPSIIDLETLDQEVRAALKEEAADKDSDLEHFMERIGKGSMFAIPCQKADNFEEAAFLVVQGKALLYIHGCGYFYYFEVTSYQKRAVSESQNELVVIGPQEAFNEDIQTNFSLLRHKIKHPDLKMKEYTIGEYSQTSVYVFYIEGIAEQSKLDEVDAKLKKITIDGVLGISYLAEHIKEKVTPFPQFQYTERPDSVAASLLEGKFALLIDGTPSALLAPVTMFSLLQSSEDYYQSYFAGSWIRTIRFFFAIISMLLPSLYVAVTTFQPEIIPTALLITIASSRENLPFSALTEALIMELTFEALREAGTRIPKPVGSTVSIIGGIVIGQAAVQAGIVSAPMIIVVSITGIASYIIPHLELGLAFRLMRFPLLILGGTMGLLGVYVAAFIVYGHLANLRSYGTPYLSPVAPLVLKDWKDIFIRVPSTYMNNRSNAYTRKNTRRQP
ncbi:spore germination protein [Paenibacillus physcomitrellae]|uniref:Spore germination protein n=1 Tax=Paenibacillus physcomitrellae TaxID=1619311 RepID=A0ABQ1GNT6_9BACL|nr:spore germination protein [Paenibacillus physcomitrellae]GGA47516.1 spore germination protein [Paenibacillus physcomitrellae]